MEVLEERSGRDYDGLVDMIEESSEEEEGSQPAAARNHPRLSHARPPLPAARAGPAGGAAHGSGASGLGRAPGIDTYFTRVPRGQPSAAALAPDLRPQSGAAAAAAAIHRPATKEEAALDVLEYANRLVSCLLLRMPVSRCVRRCCKAGAVMGALQHCSQCWQCCCMQRLAAPTAPPLAAQVFGNAAFRSQQRQIIEAALSGKDCFVLMPTGGAAAAATWACMLLLWRRQLLRLLLRLLLPLLPLLPLPRRRTLPRCR